jgi:trehalose 6-phosphate synthase
VPRLLIVSNRVALPEKGEGRPTAGGLAVAVNAALRSREGLWFGWSGKVSEETSEPRTVRHGRVDYSVIDLPPVDFDEYYNGFANRVLWPILHYRIDLAEFSRQDLSGYLRVNETFAHHLSGVIRPDDVIWVHDYHLMPLARFLRERGHANRIGFFLHIPFPPPDILKALPHHRRVLTTLADFDLVGFQTAQDRDNFGRYLAGEGGLAHGDGETFDLDGHRLRAGFYPVGIETENFVRTARRAARSVLVRETRESLVGRSLVIGVDRLDYSKGIPQRIEAFETFIEAYPDKRGAVTFLQITPKSRERIPEYAQMAAEVSAAAGRVNGRFGEVNWTPIRYVNRSYSRTALAGLYRLARVGLVTPLRDGMNLVAKEYVAAQDEADPGVLVLSEFAGAAAELSEGALLVNPHEKEAVAAAIRRALDMPLEERQERFQAMLAVLRAHGIDEWADRFLEDLTAPPRRSKPHDASEAEGPL